MGRWVACLETLGFHGKILILEHGRFKGAPQSPLKCLVCVLRSGNGQPKWQIIQGTQFHDIGHLPLATV